MYCNSLVTPIANLSSRLFSCYIDYLGLSRLVIQGNSVGCRWSRSAGNRDPGSQHRTGFCLGLPACQAEGLGKQ